MEYNRIILNINNRITEVSSILNGRPQIIKVMLVIITIFNLYYYLIQEELYIIGYKNIELLQLNYWEIVFI